MGMKSRLEVLQSIQAVGYCSEIDIIKKFNFRQLTIESNHTNSFVFALPMGTGIVIHLRLSANRGTYIQEFGTLDLAGTTWEVDWWVQDKTEPHYVFYRGHDYPHDVVLNHCIGRHGRVVPGMPREGYLLGRSRSSVPANMRDFDLPAKLTIYDGREDWEHEFSICFDHEFGHEFGPVRKPVKSSLFEDEKCPEEYRRVIEGEQENRTRNLDYVSVKDPADRKAMVSAVPADGSPDRSVRTAIRG